MTNSHCNYSMEYKRNWWHGFSLDRNEQLLVMVQNTHNDEESFPSFIAASGECYLARRESHNIIIIFQFVWSQRRNSQRHCWQRNGQHRQSLERRKFVDRRHWGSKTSRRTDASIEKRTSKIGEIGKTSTEQSCWRITLSWRWVDETNSGSLAIRSPLTVKQQL